ncbi:hypothetical protein FXO38_15801 [Capsicum annuum]|nr:hypothetical protein FXO38_15801 [Capsicum annuum]KAF3671115.1 hypothetical protein FXO37_08190 [Capsicum annuum]
MDRTLVTRTNFVGGCNFLNVLEKLYEEHKEKYESLENELTELIEHLYTWKGSVYVEKLLLNEQDLLIKSYDIYQNIIHEFHLALSLRRDSDAAEAQHSRGSNQGETVMLFAKPTKKEGVF